MPALTTTNECRTDPPRPPAVDAALRRKARAEGKSLSPAAVDALVEGARLSGAPQRRRDVSDIAGTWHDDTGFDAAIVAQDQIDERVNRKRNRDVLKRGAQREIKDMRLFLRVLRALRVT